MSAQPSLDAAARKALEGLADIAVPAPISWMPQTWGWVAVAVLLIAGLGAWVWRWRRHALANRYRREALRLLSALECQALDPRTRADALAQIPVVLKRVALAAYPRGDVASLSGPAWVAFAGARGLRTAGIVEALLGDAEYRPREVLAAVSDRDVRAVVVAARAWIEDHRVSA